MFKKIKNFINRIATEDKCDGCGDWFLENNIKYRYSTLYNNSNKLCLSCTKEIEKKEEYECINKLDIVDSLLNKNSVSNIQKLLEIIKVVNNN